MQSAIDPRCAVAHQRRNDADDAFFNTVCPAHGLSSAASPIEELLRLAHFAAEAAVAEAGSRRRRKVRMTRPRRRRRSRLLRVRPGLPRGESAEQARPRPLARWSR